MTTERQARAPRSPGRARYRLRTVRPDGTPVYRYPLRLGMPPIQVTRIDFEVDHPHLPPDHRHAHDFLVLVYIERGGGAVALDGRTTPLRDGDLHAIPPGQAIGAATLADLQHCRAWSVAFTPDAVPSLASVSPLAWAHHPLLALFATDFATDAAADQATDTASTSTSTSTSTSKHTAGSALPTLPAIASANVPEAERPRWSAWLTELTEELAEPGRVGARDAASALLTRILIAAARLAPSAPAPPDPLVTRVFDEIEATFGDPVSAADVAQALGYTPGYLTTVVRERTGRTLLEWITERRMTEVRRMLRDTDLPLAVVAARTGLRDATYLVRRFKDRYGITPDRWRRNERA
ncbi:AraC family transcriptional regulator [Promicromonospora sp. AC04]|uniref:AraC family transcriptional regulator n=1 Tax=Promicromonospora sp. AC04 TaxID=2135723 RepID=UPI001E3DF741|nr:AraC family transcriptional regulator [Promicromonospora sp. AC04]